MGTPEFAVHSLKAVFNSHHEVSAVVTVPDKPKGRGLYVSQSAVKQFALENNLKVLQPVKLKSATGGEAFISELKSLDADVFVIVAFRILPKEVFTLPRYGSFNLHASLLPKYRGAAPINWVIINGEEETGVTTFFLDKQVDAGNIILQKRCSVAPEDNAGTLHDKLAELGADVVIKTLSLIEEKKNDVPLSAQDNSLASSAPKIFTDFCKIDFHKSSSEVFNFIRGLSPYPTGYIIYNGKRIKIYSSKLHPPSAEHPHLPLNHVQPGEAIIQGGRFFIACSNGFIEITELQMEGKKRMTAEEFLRGNAIKEKHIFD